MNTNLRMPVLFVGHGSPMNAIEDSAWRREWQRLGKTLPKPRAVLCVSAHWETRGVGITAASKPETIHDFYGFPPELFAVEYPAPGDPDLARDIAGGVGDDATPVHLDPQRGIDHGAWSVLCAMYPEAGVPVLQLSLDTRRPGAWHYALAQRLAFLRDEGVLVLGSGNIVHNLMLLGRFWNAPAPPGWAVRFRDRVNAAIARRDHAALCDWPSLGPDAALAVPTPEHYLPLLYALALQRDDDGITTFNDDVFATLAMTSFVIGAGS
ncbi:MAG: 4,5-DOPA dioxygenase extradiol [Proteobacteria bacterium]|nr:4,5-DOPA dioxygenase extradiol [Pseudomonadota bacterium]